MVIIRRDVVEHLAYILFLRHSVKLQKEADKAEAHQNGKKQGGHNQEGQRRIQGLVLLLPHNYKVGDEQRSCQDKKIIPDIRQSQAAIDKRAGPAGNYEGSLVHAAPEGPHKDGNRNARGGIGLGIADIVHVKHANAKEADGRYKQHQEAKAFKAEQAAEGAELYHQYAADGAKYNKDSHQRLHL